MSTGPTRSIGVDKTDRTHSFTGINWVKEAERAGKTDNSPTEHRQQSQNVPNKVKKPAVTKNNEVSRSDRSNKTIKANKPPKPTKWTGRTRQAR